MNKNSAFSKSKYSKIAKYWFLLYMALNFLFGISFFYTQSIIIVYIALALINLYAIVLLIKEKKQGFYTLLSSEILFIAYTIITKKPSAYVTIAGLNFLFIAITWIFVRQLWNSKE